MKTGEDCYSTNGEDFDYDSAEEAAESLIEDDPEQGYPVTVWKGTARGYSASNLLPEITEHMEERAYEEVNHYSGGWEFSKTQAEELQKLVADVVEAWCDKNDMAPTFYQVENIEEITVEEQS